MDVMLPTSELPQVQRQDTDRLVDAGSRESVDAGSRESVEAAIASAQRRQPMNGSTKVAKTATDVTACRATALLQERGKGDTYPGHRKSMNRNPGRFYAFAALETPRN